MESKIICIFVHHASLARAWRRHGEGQPAWGKLCDILTAAAAAPLRAEPGTIECRGVHFYASRQPTDAARDEAIAWARLPKGVRPADDAKEQSDKRLWLTRGIDQLPDYTLTTIEECLRPSECEACGETAFHWQDKGLETHIAVDLMTMARMDLYDAAVLVSDDEELVPAVHAVQNLLRKKVIHAGFSEAGHQMRAACLNRILLDPLTDRLKAPGDPKPFDLVTAAAFHPDLREPVLAEAD